MGPSLTQGHALQSDRVAQACGQLGLENLQAQILWTACTLSDCPHKGKGFHTTACGKQPICTMSLLVLISQ